MLPGRSHGVELTNKKPGRRCRQTPDIMSLDRWLSCLRIFRPEMWLSQSLVPQGSYVGNVARYHTHAACIWAASEHCLFFQFRWHDMTPEQVACNEWWWHEQSVRWGELSLEPADPSACKHVTSVADVTMNLSETRCQDIAVKGGCLRQRRIKNWSCFSSPGCLQSPEPANEPSTSMHAETPTTPHNLVLYSSSTSSQWLTWWFTVCHLCMRDQMGLRSGCLPSRLKCELTAHNKRS